MKTIDLDEAHRYQATDLPPGRYHVCLANNEITGEGGPCYDRIGGGVEWASDVSVQAGRIVTGIDLPLRNFVDGAAVSGAILGEGDVPLGGVQVALQKWLGNGYQWGMVAVTRTDADGIYRIDDVLPGEYVFELWDLNDFYLPCPSGCGSGAHTETITLQRFAQHENVDFQMTPGGVITGAVTFGGPFPAAAAIIGATAKADDVVGGEYTVYGKYDPDSGHYAIGPLPPGMYHMVAEIPPEYEMPYSGFFTKVRYDAPIEISVTNGSNIGNVDIHFADGEYDGIMTGMVSNLDNEPLAGIRVELLQDITNYTQVFVYTQTDKNGQYGLGGLSTGRYRVRFVDPDGIYLPAYARKIGQPTNVHLLAASEFTDKLYIPIVGP